jgi:hypothetical protein
VIPEEVKPRAGAYFHKRKGQPFRLPGGDAERGEQAGSPSNLIRLYVMRGDEIFDFIPMVKTKIAENRIQIGSNRRFRMYVGIKRCQRVVCTIKQQVMNRRQKNHGNGFGNGS